MAVTPTFRYTPTGNADPSLSLGGVGYGSIIPAGLHDLFDAVNPAEALAGSVEYRAIDVRNDGADTAYDIRLFISSLTSSADDSISIGFDSTGTQSIADEVTPPLNLAFSVPVDYANGIQLGDLAYQGIARLWIRRTVAAGAGRGVSAGQLSLQWGSAV